MSALLKVREFVPADFYQAKLSPAWPDLVDDTFIEPKTVLFGKSLWQDYELIATLGFQPTAPGVATAWYIPCRGALRHKLRVIKICSIIVKTTLEHGPFHRIQALCRVDHRAIGFARAVGFKFEGNLRRFHNGTDVAILSVVRDGP